MQKYHFNLRRTFENIPPNNSPKTEYKMHFKIELLYE